MALLSVQCRGDTMKKIHLLQLPPEVVSILEFLDEKVESLEREVKELRELMAISEASFIQLEQKVNTIEEQIIEINQAAHDYDVAVTKHINDVHDAYVAGIEEAKTSATTLINQVKESAEKSISTLTDRLAAMEKIHIDLAKKELSLDLYDEDGNKADIQISKQLTLPATDEFGCTITWKSSNPEYLTDEGVVIRPTHDVGNVRATMTATLVYGETTATKDFELEVIAEEAPPEPPVVEPEQPEEETPQS